MDVGLATYLLVLLAGTALTVAIGAILRRSGQAMLAEAYPEPRAAGVTQLVTVGFYLVALGVLALISTIDVPVVGLVQTVVTKFGVVLLLLGAVYGLALLVLGRVRDARRRAELDVEQSAAFRVRP